MSIFPKPQHDLIYLERSEGLPENLPSILQVRAPRDRERSCGPQEKFRTMGRA